MAVRTNLVDAVGRRDVLLRGLLTACHVFAGVIAGVHLLLKLMRVTRMPTVLAECSAGPMGVLREIWFGRVARDLISLALRSPLRDAAIRLVCAGPSIQATGACVLAVCHTPWQRLLANWCQHHHFALIPSAAKWARHAGHAHVPWKYSGLRRLARHLRAGGRVVVIADSFEVPGGVVLNFLGRKRMASRLAARLAELANVPLVAAIPAYRDGRVRFDVGATFATGKDPLSSLGLTTQLVAYVEKEIRRKPEVWGDALRIKRCVPRC
jgi:hypothetical protein